MSNIAKEILVKYKCHRKKFFDGRKYNCEKEEKVVDSGILDDFNIQDWLHYYLL